MKSISGDETFDALQRVLADAKQALEIASTEEDKAALRESIQRAEEACQEYGVGRTKAAQDAYMANFLKTL